ncbi:MAG: SixA phosphatase family protein [Gemmatimonadales bacterium]
MQLLIIRHAIAEDREQHTASGQEDALRPLTREGRVKMRQAATGLHRLVKTLDVLATSPLARAVQTAEIVAAEYGGPEPVTVPALAPEQPPDAAATWLRTLRDPGTVAVVGHEPDLGILVGWLVAGRGSSVIELKKGAACLLEIHGQAAAGQATLLWALTPGQLRRVQG